MYLFDVDTGVMQASITASEEAMADRVIELVNQERTSRGLQPLVKDDRLMVAAAARAKELSQRYSHTRPNGSECFTILWHLGIAPAPVLRVRAASGADGKSPAA